MRKNKLTLAMLGASATFALLTAWNVQAQSATPSQQGATAPATAGKSGTTHDARQASGQSGTQGNLASGSGKALNRGDQKLLRNLALANMAEIDAARMAQSKGQSEEVKTFAQRMIDDHTKALNEVQQLAQSKGVTLPTELDRMHQAKVDRLSRLSGEQFDQVYMAQAGVADHKKTHSQLGSAAKASDPDVKALASRMQPSVDEHLKMAQDMRGKSGGSTAVGSSGGGSTVIGPSGSPGTGSVTGVNGSGTPPAGNASGGKRNTDTSGTSTERK